MCFLSEDQIELLFQRFQSLMPNPQTELNYTNPFTLLIAVLLSAQSTDKGVNKATKNLFEIADTPQKMLDLGLEQIYEHIKTIGLYKTKGVHIIKLCELLLLKHEGKVPSKREDLEALPGVGRKTANVILNVVFGQLTLAVDTHIFRLANRLGLSAGKTPLKVEEDLLKIIPKSYLYNAHHWLILQGRYVCKAQKPLCETCIQSDICKSAFCF